MNRQPLQAPPKTQVQASPELRAQVERERQSGAFNNCVMLHRADPSKVGVIGSPSFNACLEAGLKVASQPGGASREEVKQAQIEHAQGTPPWVWALVALAVLGGGFLVLRANKS